MDWASISATKVKPRRLQRDKAWSARLFLKLSSPLLACMVSLLVAHCNHSPSPYLSHCYSSFD